MKRKYALITGGTKGIGRSTVEIFAKHKYNIITCARDTNDLKKLNQYLEDKYGIDVLFSSVDLTKKKDCKRFTSLVKDTVPHINILVNNAGIYVPEPMLSETDEVFEDTFHANVFAPYYITKDLFELVQKVEGHIFNIASIASKKPFDNCASYVASKFALHGLTLSLREITKAMNVKVTSVQPGATFTASWAGANIDPERIMNPDAVADAIYACAQIKGNAVIEEIVMRPQLGDL